ncbi:MAG: UDP-N-acetylmuramoyl-L-alanine--D-glutamate ligase [Verrucomicrobiota bacterium]|nr:UDP-N-acetylmuramoyl-L-alanine--D-glutamate ligase [Verrucomicrobiota bacterium]
MSSQRQISLPAEALAHPIAIMGAGVSGLAVRELCVAKGFESVIYDERNPDADSFEFGLAQVAKHKLVVFSPGFSPQHGWLALARSAGCICIGETDFGSLFWPGNIIAITGTNGKTTLCDFLTEALNQSGFHAYACGNIGLPLSKLACEAVNGAVAVCEISSFQAETLNYFRADALIWTNFSETHLDRHNTLKEYFTAKWNLLSRMRQSHFYCDESVAAHASQFGYELPPFTKIAGKPDPELMFGPESAFSHAGQRRNLMLAIDFWRDADLNRDQLLSIAATFGIRSNRLHKVTEADGVSWWNDSKSTNFAAVFGALEQFNQPVIWIGGGQNRGGDIEGFAHRLRPRIRAAYVLGEVGPKLEQLFSASGVCAKSFTHLAGAVAEAYKSAQQGDVVLLSPGFSSQDQFTGYAERGTLFEQSVLQLLSP